MGYAQFQEREDEPGAFKDPVYAAKALASTFFPRVYSWMTFGLCLTAAVAWFTAATPALWQPILGNPILFWGLLIGELVLVGWLAARVHKMSYAQAGTMFVVYSAINGLTLSVIFLVYAEASIAKVFLLTAGMFGAMSLYGYTTNYDLTSWGNFAFMAVIGLIIAGIVNIFWASSTFSWIVSVVGVITFVILTAYDTQKLKALQRAAPEGSEDNNKLAVIGALEIYLDFINLFLYLLRLFGSRDD